MRRELLAARSRLPHAACRLAFGGVLGFSIGLLKPPKRIAQIVRRAQSERKPACPRSSSLKIDSRIRLRALGKFSGHGVEPENDRARRNHSARAREGCENRIVPVDAHKSKHRPRAHAGPAEKFVLQHRRPLLHLLGDSKQFGPLGTLLLRLHLSLARNGSPYRRRPRLSQNRAAGTRIRRQALFAEDKIQPHAADFNHVAVL